MISEALAAGHSARRYSPLDSSITCKTRRYAGSTSSGNTTTHTRARPTVPQRAPSRDRKSTRLNSSHGYISYAVFCLKKKKPRSVELAQKGRAAKHRYELTEYTSYILRRGRQQSPHSIQPLL